MKVSSCPRMIESQQNWNIPWFKQSSLLSEPMFLKNIYLFIWLRWVLVEAQGIFSCGMWHLVPWPGIKPCPLYWEHRAFATGPPRKSLNLRILIRNTTGHFSKWETVTSSVFPLQVNKAPISQYFHQDIHLIDSKNLPPQWVMGEKTA